VTGYTYNANQTTVKDPAGNKRETITDGLGRLTDVYEDPAGQNLHTVYTYNALDSLTNVHQAGAAGDNALPDRVFTYDWMQRLVTAYNPESGTTCYGTLSGSACTANYDADGNVSQKTDANQTVTTMGYDELDRMVTKSYSNATPPSTYVAAPAVTYTYDDGNVPYSVGRLTAVSNGNVWQVYGFDQLGRPTASAETAGGGTYTFLSYQYNLADQLTSVKYPSGRVIQTTYDAAGRISAVNGVPPGGGQTPYASVPEDYVNHVYGYAAHGAVQQMTLGALTEQTCYNVRLQPFVVRLGTGTVDCNNPTTPSGDKLNLAYGYALNGDATKNNGNLQSQTMTRSGAALSQSYTYDGLNRLYTASEGSNWCQAYGYDGYGNRAVLPSVANVCTSWTPNPYGTATAPTQFMNNRWSGANYDAAGNQTALTSRTYWYDSENRMAWASGPNIGWTAYGYDGEGRRVTKLVCPSGVAQAQCTASLNGANLTVYAYDAHGKLAAEYGPQADAGTRYLMSDHLGSTRAVVDGTGAVQQCNDYLPFGEDVPAGMSGRSSCFPSGNYPGAGPDKANQKFTGKERDWESALDYFGARYFSAAGGRFASPDPKMIPSNLAAPQGWNKYAYSLNHPLRYTDPDGRSPQDSIGTQQFERDARAVAAGKMTSSEFQARNGARAVGAAAGAAAVSSVYAPTLGAFARGLWYSLVSYLITPNGQHNAAALLEGAAGAPPGSMGASLIQAEVSRLKGDEVATGWRLAVALGRDIIESPHEGEEFIDVWGNTFDAVGGPRAFQRGNIGQIMASIGGHLNKVVDFIVVDLSGATEAQINDIKGYLSTLSPAQRARIILLGN
jgi:RHS repeat-associated protein